MTRRLLLPLALLALEAATLPAQGVVIAPHAVYIDARARSASVLLYNPNAEPAEVTISTFFGYPVTDSLGRIVLRTVDHPDSTDRSAAGWIQAFPRRLTVAPLERQTIRLLATPPAALPDGEYWARLVIAAKGGQVPITGVTDTAKVKVGLTLEVRTIIGMAYRKGAVRTGVAISRLRGAVAGDSLELWSRIERQGNAAYVGTIHGSLVDSSGRVRAEFRAPIGVYYVLEPRYAAAVGALAPGRYWLKLELTTQREDLAPEVILPSAAVRDSVELRIP
jgi:P pilus assembly chaperone PapD